MDFYKEWEDCVKNNQNDNYYINSFLFCSLYSIESLENSSKQNIKRIINFLISYDKRKVIEEIKFNYIKNIKPCDVPQFSNFEKATFEITQILKYENSGLTFEELGYLLMDSKNKLSRTKYGENQAKTARIFNLVVFSQRRPTEVRNSSLGDEFPFLNQADKEKLLSILCLRNPVIMYFIAKSKVSKVNYDEVVSCLSESTRIRRKANVKYLLDLALNDVKKDFINNIFM